MRHRTNTGARCQRWQRVPGPGGLLRCAKFRLPGRRPLSFGFQRGNVPHNAGRTCKRYQTVYSPFLDQKVERCESYGPRRRRRAAKAPRSTRRPEKRSMKRQGAVKLFFGTRPGPKASMRRKVVQKPPKKAAKTTTRKTYLPYALPGIAKITIGRTPVQRGRRKRARS